MRVNITGRHLEITPSLKSYIEKKVEKIKYYFDHIIDVHVILDLEKNSQKAEVTVSGEGKTFFCEVKTQDMYESIDKLFDKLERQVRKYKERLVSHKVTAISDIFSVDRGMDVDSFQITKIIQSSPRPMNEHEAILQLNLNKSRFNIFHPDLETQYQSIAFKKDDGMICLIHKDNGNWIQKHVKIEDNNVVEIEKQNIDIETYTGEEAIEKLAKEGLDYIIFSDDNKKSLNIIYIRKNKTLGLITGGK